MAEIGTILGGRYRLVELLGQGGMATIFRSLDTQLGREVAVKLLRPEYLRDPDFSSRFRQEAQNAASLSHPNVVTVYDYGEDPSGPFIVMEYVDGEDLATILRRNGALPPTQAARIAAAVARALAASHARGIVHRDVKPGNVLIGRDAGGLGRRQGAVVAQDRCEILAVNVLHDDERPLRVLAVVVDRDDVRMTQ